MSKKIVIVNAGPRIGWNTDTLQLKDYNATDWNGIGGMPCK